MKRMVVTLSLRTDRARDATSLMPLARLCIDALHRIFQTAGWDVILDTNLTVTSARAMDKRWAEEGLTAPNPGEPVPRAGGV